MKKILFFIREGYKSIFCFCILIQVFAFGQQPGKINYHAVFGSKYPEAAGYLAGNTTLSKALLLNNINPCLAKAIVFPEVLRYSYLRDKMEIQALLTLYVQYGNEYADFSVGRFQIKPTFAQEIEKDIVNNPEFRKDKKIDDINISNTAESRLARVRRLEKDEWQIQYLIWFIKLVENKFKHILWSSEDEKVKFFATAFNCGYKNSFKHIKNMMDEDLFHTTILKGRTLYNYSDISYYYWQSCPK